jgi:aminomethyltransferase
MLKRTPLYESHVALDARRVEFGGWEMPVQYSSLIEEHHATRTAAGLFDISHMGRFLVIGPDSLSFLQYLTTYDVSRIEMNMSGYSLMCTPTGGVVDDVFIYNLPNAYMVVVNAANRQKDWDWVLKQSYQFNVKMIDYSDYWAMIALQGPQAEAILQHCDIATEDDSDTSDTLPCAELTFHGVTQCALFGVPETLISRTGYTGEDGFEIFFNAKHAEKVWSSLLSAGKEYGLKPCGLGARDSLRFEACLPLYGHELSEEIHPFEARLGWVIGLDKDHFIGRDALTKIHREGSKRRLVGFEVTGGGVARSEYPILDLDGNTIGVVTSGMPSPTLQRHLGLGFVPMEMSQPGTEIEIQIRKRTARARIVRTPFYKPRYKKQDEKKEKT